MYVKSMLILYLYAPLQKHKAKFISFVPIFYAEKIVFCVERYEKLVHVFL